MSNKVEPLDNPTDLDPLSLAYQQMNEAVIHHRNLAYNIFSWSTTLLLAFVGFALSQGKALSGQDRLFLTFAVGILFVVVYVWQVRNGLETKDHQESIARIDKLLHLTEPGYFGSKEPIYGLERHEKLPIWRLRFGFFYYNFALVAMTLIVVVAIWRL